MVMRPSAGAPRPSSAPVTGLLRPRRYPSTAGRAVPPPVFIHQAKRLHRLRRPPCALSRHPASLRRPPAFLPWPLDPRRSSSLLLPRTCRRPFHHQDPPRSRPLLAAATQPAPLLEPTSTA
ncbi:hypothetical protein BRADI_2g36903v3 [Brachypodium distachyon]|uniref:Uncharacterized protein n=1 Tax=Brachypodium distachyon TaxID=15368 RepID=A0A0Q3IP86_BRADI|nr:hypothetical protein BRADI_2g36903v3 [Brachypodium distachyon]PNT71891.1 hypothetical protein BRADI_2g36903v3 [Brachypodium distachyon]